MIESSSTQIVRTESPFDPLISEHDVSAWPRPRPRRERDPHLRALTLLENCAAVQGEKCAIRYWIYDAVEPGEFTSWVGEASASDAELTS